MKKFRKMIAAGLAAVMTTVFVSSAAFAEDEKNPTGMTYDEETGTMVPTYDDYESDVGKVREGMKKYLDEHKNDYINHEKTLQESIDDLSSMGLISGFPDGGFHVDENITRAQLAVMICRAVYGTNYSKVDKEGFKKAMINIGEYEDLPEDHWAFTELSALCVTSYLTGSTENGSKLIRPDDNVTYIETAAVLLRWLNYFDAIDEHGGYPDGVEYWANNLNLFGRTNAESNLNAPATRGDVIIMFSTALDSPPMVLADKECRVTETLQQSPLTKRQHMDLSNWKNRPDEFAPMPES